jgi:hypothetical protein
MGVEYMSDSIGQDFDSQPATNPAEPYMPLLEKYLPGVQLVARPCWCIYSFDPQQLARLIRHIEETVSHVSDEDANDAITTD